MAIIRRIEKIAIALIILMESLRFAIYCGLKCSLTSVEFGADVFGMELASNIFCRWFIEVLLFVGVPILLAVLYYCLRRHKVVEDMFKSVNLRIVSVSVLTVSAFIFGKWVVYAISMMGMDLDGVSDAVGLSSGWGGVGVLWGVYAAVLWALLQGIVFKGKCGSNCVYVAVFIFVLNCLVFSKDQILSSPIEIRLPQNLFNVLNSSKGNELSVNWYIISDESNVVSYCASPVGVYWFDMQPALKIKGFDNSGSLTCVKERRYKSIGESGSHVTFSCLGDDDIKRLVVEDAELLCRNDVSVVDTVSLSSIGDTNVVFGTNFLNRLDGIFKTTRSRNISLANETRLYLGCKLPLEMKQTLYQVVSEHYVQQFSLGNYSISSSGREYAHKLIGRGFFQEIDRVLLCHGFKIKSVSLEKVVIDRHRKQAIAFTDMTLIKRPVHEERPKQNLLSIQLCK